MDLYDTVTENSQLKIFGYNYLPIGIIKENRKEYVLEKVDYSNKEAEKKARDRLDKYLQDLRKKGVSILENNVKIEIKDGILKARGSIKCEELIGAPLSINILNQGETPDGFTFKED